MFPEKKKQQQQQWKITPSLLNQWLHISLTPVIFIWQTSQETEMYFAEFKRSCLGFWAFLYVSLLRFVDCQCNNINLTPVKNIIIVWLILGVLIFSLHVIERYSNHAQTMTISQNTKYIHYYQNIMVQKFHNKTGHSKLRSSLQKYF